MMVFCGLFPAVASAQPLPVPIGPPLIHWDVQPRLTVAWPGVWVVEDSPDEVFFYNDWYWTQQSGRWYRSRDHHGHWIGIEQKGVPGRFYALEPGHYRHFRGGEALPQGHGWPGAGHSGPSYWRNKWHGAPERGFGNGPERQEGRRAGPGNGPERQGARRAGPGNPERQEARHGDPGNGPQGHDAKRGGPGQGQKRPSAPAGHGGGGHGRH